MGAAAALAELQKFRPGDLEDERFIQILTDYEARLAQPS
jgi:hypothetical protein